MECVRSIMYILRVKLGSQQSRFQISHSHLTKKKKDQNNKAHKEILQDHLKYKDYKLIPYFVRCCGCNVPLSAQSLQQKTLML